MYAIFYKLSSVITYCLDGSTTYSVLSQLLFVIISARNPLV